MSSSYGKFTETEKEWISNNIKGKFYKDVVSEFNAVFGKNIKESTFRHRCVFAGLRENGKVGGLNDFTDEQDEWLRNNIDDGWDVCASNFNATFGTNYNREKIRGHVRRFMKCRSNRTRQDWQKQLPLFSKRYNEKDDCIEIKICAEIGKCKWIPEHKYICEQVYGKLPKDVKIIHLNGNRKDNRLENLYVTTNSVMISARTTYNWDNKNPIYRACALENSELKMILDGKR